MEDRVRNLEITVAVMGTQLSDMKEAIERNTEAQQQVALALAAVKDGKAVLVGVGLALGSIISMLISWFKG